MYSRIVWVLAFVCLLGAVSSVAQDPLKVEPAHYKLAFENEHVQVVYIHYGPHEKSSLHDHPPGVVVNLTNGHLRFFDQNGSVQEVRATHGEARWFPAFRHRVENLSDTSFDGVYIAVKHAGTVAMTAPKSATPAIDEETQGIINAFVLLAKMSNEQGHKKR